MVSALLEARAISYAYTPGVPVVRQVSLAIMPGQTLFILGRNGGGKTTLLNCLAGIRRPTEGAVLLDGKDIATFGPQARARAVGLIPQIHTPAFAYSVREMVLMGRAPHLGFLGSPTRADHRIAEDALASVGLSALAERPYTEVSGGERQLVLIARGLAQKCRVLLMDEPSAHLDPSNTHRVLETVNQLTRMGLSFVITSHAPNNALAYADHVLLMKAGKAITCGTPEETLTEELLTRTYDMPTEVITSVVDGRTIPRAIIARRPLVLPPETLGVTGTDLEAIRERSRTEPQLLIVTGLSGAGKTTYCQRLAARAKELGLAAGGVLSPAVFEGDNKTRIDMVDVATGERRVLAMLPDGGDGELATPHWRFVEDTVRWGDDLLKDAAADDLLFVDELGVLEFTRGQGLMNAMRRIDEGRYRLACVVVRSALLPEAEKRWPKAHVLSGIGWRPLEEEG